MGGNEVKRNFAGAVPSRAKLASTWATRGAKTVRRAFMCCRGWGDSWPPHIGKRIRIKVRAGLDPLNSLCYGQPRAFNRLRHKPQRPRLEGRTTCSISWKAQMPS
jgi:hypothetical protein